MEIRKVTVKAEVDIPEVEAAMVAVAEVAISKETTMKVEQEVATNREITMRADIEADSTREITILMRATKVATESRNTMKVIKKKEILVTEAEEVAIVVAVEEDSVAEAMVVMRLNR